MKTLVLGLGNSILSDDSLGLRVASEIKRRIDPAKVHVLESELGGINLIETLDGYDRAIIIDAIQTNRGKPGDIYQLTPESIIGTRHTNSAHGIDFCKVIELGKVLGINLPSNIIIFAIEAEDTCSFSESCSPSVSSAIPVCASMVIQILNQNN